MTSRRRADRSARPRAGHRLSATSRPAARPREALHQHWAKDLDARLAEHESGQGARLTQVQLERGGSWRLARTEPGTRDRENQLKERGASRDCPICKTERAEQAQHEKEVEAGS